MGNVPSRKGFVHSANDYQLAIEASKELEYLLEKEFGAFGAGLHEKVSSVESSLPVTTVRSMRFVASVRNALIHDREVRALPDRARFIEKFDAALGELHVLVDKKNLDTRGSEDISAPGCIVS